MAAYKDLVGQKITVVTSNPPEPKTGQMWYNSTDGKLRGLSPTSAWRSSAPIIVARDAAGSAGTQSTATIFGGNINPGNTNSTDEYNGSGFSSGGTLNTARRQTSGCGTQTAALCVAGYTTANAANVEEYNGTSWAEQNDIPGNYRNGSTFGTQTAALYVGGYSVPVPNSTTIQIYDGTNWTTSPATLGTGGNSISSTGTSTAGLVFGGSNRLNLTEEWNGSAMSTGGNMSTSKYGRGSANQAPSENAMSAGGGIPAQTTVENYNGTTWSTLPSLAVATNSIRGAGTATSAMMMGGGPGAGPVFNTSTEFDKSTNTITAAAWASATAMPRNHGEHIAGAGSAADGLAFGGEGPSNYNYTEEWNGSSWTAGGNWPSNDESIMACGLTGTTALGFGGINNASPGVRQSTSAKYDGSSWTTTNSLPTAKRAGAGFGINTSAVCMGGDTAPGSANNTVEEWDGTNWTAVPNAPFGMGNMGGGTGTLTAGLIFGGYTPSPGATTGNTYEYDGTNWTSGGTMNTARNQVNGWGGPAGQTASMCGGGSTGSVSAATEGYDGTSWSTRPNLATARQGSANGIGTSQTTGIQAGGSTGSYVTNTEEFTGETTAANIADFATS